MIQQLHHASWLLSDAYPRLSPEATGNASREDLEWAVSVSIPLCNPFVPSSVRFRLPPMREDLLSSRDFPEVCKRAVRRHCKTFAAGPCSCMLSAAITACQ